MADNEGVGMSITPMAFTTKQSETIILEAATRGKDLVFHIFPKKEYFARSADIKRALLASFADVKVLDFKVEYVQASDGVVPIPACLDMTSELEEGKLVYKNVKEEDIPKESFFVQVEHIGANPMACEVLCNRIIRDL